MDLIVGATKKSFEFNIEYGKEWEDRFAKWLILKEWFVTPKYLFAEEGAPLLIGKNNKYAIPDIDAAKNGERIWFECKRKRIMEKHPATGFSEFAFENYKKVQEITGDKVFVIFEDIDIEGKGNRINSWKHYGNYIDKLEKHIYARNWNFELKPHIVFKYPDAFISMEI